MKKNPQAEVSKSAIALAAAAIMVGLTWTVYRTTQPGVPDQFVKVGQVFFEPFETKQIARMELAALDKNGKLLSFTLRRVNDLWTIPSHHDYPAEATERLSRTATELIGLERRRLASGEKGAQERLGTLDPTSEEGQADPENAGKILRFLDTNGDEIFNLIVGKEVEKTQNPADPVLGLERDAERLYYVRVPTEKETYVAKLELDISTKFTDWINRDLLELNTREMRQLRVDNSRLETRQVLTNQGIAVQRQRIPGEELVLEKSGDFTPWTLPGLKADEEELNTEFINQVVSTIENVELVGVRPRYKFQGQAVLDANFGFQFPAEIGNDVAAQQEIVDQLQDDLLSRGFGLTRDPQSNAITLVSDHGEFSVVTRDGLVYTLYFGAPISGSDDAIEIGAGEVVKAGAEPAEEPAADPENPAPEAKDPAANPPAAQGRFLLVRVAHDRDRMSDAPVPPVEPEPMVLPPGIGEPATETPATESPATEPPTTASPPVAADGEAGEREQTGQDQSGQRDSGDREAGDGDATVDDGDRAREDGDDVNRQRGPFARQDEATKQEQAEQQGEGERGETQEVAREQEQSDDQEQEKEQAREQAQTGGETRSAEQEQAAGQGPPGQQDPEQAPPSLTREDMQKALDAEFERQKAAFQDQQRQYALDVQAFEERVAKAEEKARRLSERFANWYYVVPTSDLDRLRLTRADVVKPKDLAVDNPLGVPPGQPGGLPPGLLEGLDLPPSGLPRNGG